MRSAAAIAMREYASFFRIPLGWVVVALFVCLSSAFFVRSAIVPGTPASMREFFSIWWGLLLVVAPAISMRLFSEELRSGTIETALTAPVADTALVVGKYAAGVLFLMTMLLPTLGYVLLLSALARPDFGPILAGYAGLLLLGMLYIAVGCVASALTSSQTLAFLGTLFALLGLDLALVRLAGESEGGVQKALYSLSPNIRAADFARGLIDTSSVAYFLIVSAFFLMVATMILQSRRWR